MARPHLSARLSVQLGVLAATTIVLSFATQWFIITRLGAGLETDTLFAGLAIPQLLVAVVSNPLTYVLVPLLAHEKPEALGAESWGLFLTCCGIFGALALSLWLTVGIWVPLLVPGFPASAQAVTADLTQIQLLGMTCMGVSAVPRSLYHARNQFIWTAVAAALAAAVSLVYLAAAINIQGGEAAAWAFSLRSAVELALLIPVLGVPDRVTLSSPMLSAAWRQIRPLMLGASYERTELVLDRLLASWAPPGSLSLYYLGQQIFGAAGQIINRAIALPVTADLARQARNGEWGRFRHTVSTRTIAVLVITTAVVATVAVVGEPLLGAALGGGRVRPGDVHLLWLIMLLLAGLLIGDPVGHMVSTGFYCLGDTVRPTMLAAAAFTIGAVAKIMGFWSGGILGLAGATSAYWVLRIALLRRGLSRRIASDHVPGTRGAHP